ncbi:MAG: dTDP-glucose 4,6-dehydratase [Anaerolineales bacterium]|nr:dTDP-glucose 4,6-dehydratase [Anaerolineales bacterium]
MIHPLQDDLDHILGHVRDGVEELRGARLFVTGGSGFFGKWILESLIWMNQRLNLDCRVTVLTRSPDSFRARAPQLAEHEIISAFEGDIRSFEFPAGTFTHIIHAATESSAKLNAEAPLLMLDTIIAGTRRALDFAKTCGAKKFLFTSSGAVYGKQPPDMTHISEEYPGAPVPFERASAYGHGKRLAEHLCALYADASLEVKIARGFAFVGPYLPLDIHFAIGNFIRDALRGGPIIVQGDGTPRRSYLYAADLAIWLWTILLRGESCRPYNVGGEESLSIAETARSVAGCVSPSMQVEVRGVPNPASAIERYVPSTSRARDELGLTQLIGMKDATRRTLQYFRGRI